MGLMELNPRLCSSWGSQEKFVSKPLLAPGGHPHSLACDHITPTRASIHTTFSDSHSAVYPF